MGCIEFMRLKSRGLHAILEFAFVELLDLADGVHTGDKMTMKPESSKHFKLRYWCSALPSSWSSPNLRLGSAKFTVT